MRKAAIVMMVAFVAVMILAPTAMAQETGATSGGGKALGALAVAVGMGAAGDGAGVGRSSGSVDPRNGAAVSAGGGAGGGGAGGA